MEDLMKLRESIDEIDNEIVRLYKERMEISKHVAEYKITTGKKVFDKTREDEKNLRKFQNGLARPKEKIAQKKSRYLLTG